MCDNDGKELPPMWTKESAIEWLRGQPFLRPDENDLIRIDAAYIAEYITRDTYLRLLASIQTSDPNAVACWERSFTVAGSSEDVERFYRMAEGRDTH